MDERSHWKKLASRVSYKNPYYQIREDDVIQPDGKRGKYYLIDAPPSVFIVPVTSDKKICLIGLYRYTTDTYSWEVPAGGIDNDGVLKAAKRELLEETCLKSDNWTKLGKLQAFNGRSNNRQYVFLANNVRQTSDNKKKEEGITKTKRVTYREVLSMIRRNKITDSESIAALFLAGLHLKLL